MPKLNKINSSMYRFKQINKKILFSVFILTFTYVINYAQSTVNKKFTLVIDAGHGGKDGGAQSSVRDLNGSKIQEKDVSLAVALKLGKMIEENLKEVKVVYTRREDVFVELLERAQIANRSKADLFVAIHCNSARSNAEGSETWILGSDDSRQSSNMEVMKRENSVIYLEDNYEKKYDGFDPNSAEDIIAMTLMQSMHYDSSFKIASYIEKEYKSNNRFSRGIKQGGWLVITKTAMPGVLTEIGFLSNENDALFISSEEGQNKIAASLYNGFKEYLKEWQLKHKPIVVEVEKPKEIEKPIDGVEYKIQFLTSTSKYNVGDIQLRGIKDIQIIKEGEYFKYYYGKTALKSERDRHLNLAKKAGFVEARVIETKKNEKLTKGFYSIQLVASRKKYSRSDIIFNKFPDVERDKSEGIFYYTFGKFYSLVEAEKMIEKAKENDFTEAFIIKNEK